MKTSYIAIIGIIVVVIAAAAVGILLMGGNVTNTVSASSSATKLDIKNNHNTLWMHKELVIQNATLQNGTKGTVYIEAWIPPNTNKTLDLSNILGYNNTPLPSNLVIDTYSGLYNNTAGGTDNLSITLKGIVNGTVISSADITKAAVPVGAKTNIVNPNTTDPVYIFLPGTTRLTNETGDPAIDVTFTEFSITPGGVITITKTPVLCQTVI